MLMVNQQDLVWAVEAMAHILMVVLMALVLIFLLFLEKIFLANFRV
jgi:hypothetical protein